ncbi:MAG TPA: TM2 domain-containing protein [Pyrinomonadaceae bacterium]|jgi:TM2 domain-containing membrane protein YozV|nr:TM2 domain-containing protein [Pyrinomonadaceae bacterium]
MAEVGAAELAQYQMGMTDQQRMLFVSQYNSDRKDRSTALILSILLGTLGIDRFYVGDTLLGLLKLLTFGGCWIWAVVDWFLIMDRADEYNRAKAQELMAVIRMQGGLPPNYAPPAFNPPPPPPPPEGWR